MSFRNKLLLVLVGTVVITTLAVSLAVAAVARGAFQRQEQERSQAIAAQFRREFDRNGEDVARRVSAVAESEPARRIALDLGHAEAGAYLNEAGQLASTHALDFLDFITAQGAIVSSAEFPARFGYIDEWASLLPKLSTAGASLRKQELPNGSALAIFAVRTIPGGEQPVYVAGGVRLDVAFLNSLAVPDETRVNLWSPGEVSQLFSGEAARQVAAAARSGEETVVLRDAPPLSQTAHVVPLKGPAGEVLSVLTIFTSRAELLRTEQHIRSIALLVAGLGILLAILISGWIATRVTQPVAELVAGARRVAAGDWNSRVSVNSGDELGQLAQTFNGMTAELVNQRDRLVQAERVAAWRELARRLAHELKNPLFPLQITVENLVRARRLTPAEFDEVFRESTATLATELANLRTIIGRFSDFSKMPRPQLEPVPLNEVVSQAVKSHQAQLEAHQPPIEVSLQLDPSAPVVEADPALLHRALANLLLNAIDAMPQGGSLRVSTRADAACAAIEVEDSGAGMTPEECERLFTPYYTTKQHGTGLGLAIVQSVVSDHGGRISVQSGAGRGTTFRIELPAANRAAPAGSAGLEAGHTEKIASEPG